MAVIETWLKQDLMNAVHVKPLNGNLFSADNNGNMIGVEVFRNGEPETLTGSVYGYVVRADGATIPVTGSKSGNKASIILPASCYAVVGQISIVVKNDNTTIGACAGYVYRSVTDTVIDPGTVVPSLSELLAKISDCEQATASATAAANAVPGMVAETFATNKAYTVGSYVYYNGSLYRFTADHAAGAWDGSDVTVVKLGNDVSDFKKTLSNAIERELPLQMGLSNTLTGTVINSFNASNAIDGKIVRVSTRAIGNPPSGMSASISEYIPVLPGDVVTFSKMLSSSTFGNALCNSNKEIIDVKPSNNANKRITIPDGVYWIIASLLTEDKDTYEITINRPSNTAVKTYIDAGINAISDTVSNIIPSIKEYYKCNLVNASEVLEGKYWHYNNDKVQNNADWFLCKIPVSAGDRIFVHGLSNSAIGGGVGYAVRNENDDTTIAYGDEYDNWYLTIPDGGAWLYFSCEMTARNTLVLSVFNGEPKFESTKFPFPVLNTQDLTHGIYINSDGEIAENTAYGLTGFMKIVGGQTYEVNVGTLYPNSRCGGFYDANKIFLSICPSSSVAADGGKYTFVAPANAEYVRLCGQRQNLSLITCTLVCPEIPEIPDVTKDIIIVGDSWSDMDTASPYTKWPAVFAQCFDGNIYSYARNGSKISGADNWALNGTVGGQVAAVLTDTSYETDDIGTVFIVGGINDYRANATESTVLSAISSHVSRLRTRFPNAHYICVFNHQLYVSKDQFDFFTQLCRDVRQTIGIPAFTSFGWFSANHMITSDYVHPDNDGHMAFAANMLSIYNGGNPVRVSNSLTLTGINAIVTINETFTDASIVRNVAVNIHDVSSSGREAFAVQQGSGLLSNAPFNAYCGEKAPTELFNPDTISSGVYLNESGEIQSSGIYALSDYIAVEPETTYYVANGTIYPNARCGAFYNEDKSWNVYAPSSSAASDAKAYTLTTPANVHYMRICYLTENTGSQSVSKQMDTINKAVAVIGTSDAVPTESKKRPTAFRFAVNYNENGEYSGIGIVI